MSIIIFQIFIICQYKNTHLPKCLLYYLSSIYLLFINIIFNQILTL